MKLGLRKPDRNKNHVVNQMPVFLVKRRMRLNLLFDKNGKKVRNYLNH